MVADAKIFEETSYVNLTGDGYDLPHGCILDTMPHHSENGLQWIYWNPYGVALSNDTHIRQICVSGNF